jgi:hypothetical protein
MRVPFAATLAALVAACLSGCLPPRDHAELPAVSEPMTAAAQKQWPNATAASLQHGHDQMQMSCTKCHSMPSVHHESEKEWPDVMKSMAKKAKLDADTEVAMLHYVLAAQAVTPKK